jgi:RNA polymerase sigma factor (sigma-70 family)
MDMRERNDGVGEDHILLNQFTAYLMKAVKNRKIQYLSHKAKLSRLEKMDAIIEPLEEFDLLSGLPVIDQLEDRRLQKALHRSNERDLYILFTKTLGCRSLAEIAKELNMGFYAVTSAYYRVLRKLRQSLEGDE